MAKALSYPCRQLLGEWGHENLACVCQPLKKEQPAVKCTGKQKMDAVLSVASGEKTSKQIQAEIGVSRITIWQWKQKSLGEETNPEMKRGCRRRPE